MPIVPAHVIAGCSPHPPDASRSRQTKIRTCDIAMPYAQIKDAPERAPEIATLRVHSPLQIGTSGVRVAESR
jgi:hypothetical protein